MKKNILKFDKIISYGYASSNLSTEITGTIFDWKIKIWVTYGVYFYQSNTAASLLIIIGKPSDNYCKNNTIGNSLFNVWGKKMI